MPQKILMFNTVVCLGHQAHGSSCTEAFFRGHVERETRLREEEEIERGSSSSSNSSSRGGKGSGMKPKEGRRASMVEVLRRIRRGDLRQTSSSGGGSRRGGNGAQPPSVALDEEHRQHLGADGDDDEGGELFIQQERLEALALALKQRGHALPARSAPADAADAGPAAAAVGVDVSGNAGDDPGGVTSFSSDVRRSNNHGRDSGGRVGETGRGKNARTGGSSSARNKEPQVRAQDRGQHPEQVHEELGGDDEGMLNLLTPEERERFLREVASGRLGKLIVPWVPWWTQTARVQEVTTMTAGGRTSHSLPPPVVDPCHHTMCSLGGQEDEVSSPPTRPSTPEQQQQSYGSELSSGGGSRRRGSGSSSSSSISSSSSGGAKQTPSVASSVGESMCTRHSFAALLCQPFHGAPDFSTICAKRPSPTLPALAADLVYAYALVARLYNGCWCSDPVGASLALVGASPVLKDGATPATVGLALTACVERAVEGEGAAYRGYAESLREVGLVFFGAWIEGREMVCLVPCSRRYVVR